MNHHILNHQKEQNRLLKSLFKGIFMKKFNLTSEEMEDVENAVKKAEQNTSGEIATAIIKESSDYAFYEIIVALIAGFIAYMICLYLYTPISVWLESLFWEYTAIYSAAFLGTAAIISIGTVYLLANIPGADRFIVPRRIISKNVKQRAVNYFSEAGLFNTRDRSGILIFISYREKRIELLADSGISALISEEKWKDIVDTLVRDIKKKETGRGLVKAIAQCGKLLAEHFPIKDDDTNELNDGINILED